METKYFIDANGIYLGAFSGYQPPPILIQPEEGEPFYQDQPYVWPDFPLGATEVPTAPDDARQVYHNGGWLPIPMQNVSRITAGQLQQQLIIDGNDEQVGPAIQTIPDITKRKLVAARYEFESFFNIDDPDLLLLAGAVGYDTPEKIQEFFNKASLL